MLYPLYQDALRLNNKRAPSKDFIYSSNDRSLYYQLSGSMTQPSVMVEGDSIDIVIYNRYLKGIVRM